MTTSDDYRGSEAREEKAAELELWRQAYNAVIGGRCVNLPASEVARFADKIADQALADYRAKREEMGI